MHGHNAPFKFEPKCGDVPSLSSHSLQDRFWNYEWITALPRDATHFDIFWAYPDIEIRRHLAIVLLDFAVAWLLLHERAHVLKGHLGFLRDHRQDFDTILHLVRFERYQNTIPADNSFPPYTIEQMDLHGLEFDADLQATRELVHRNLQESIFSIYPREVLTDTPAVLYYTGVAIGVVHLVLRLME